MSVSIWQHVIVVIGLLTSNAVTFFTCKQRIEELQAALLAKKVLLGRDADEIFCKDKVLLAGETLSLRDDKGNRLDITTFSATKLDVKVYPA